MFFIHVPKGLHKRTIVIRTKGWGYRSLSCIKPWPASMSLAGSGFYSMTGLGCRWLNSGYRWLGCRWRVSFCRWVGSGCRWIDSGSRRQRTVVNDSRRGDIGCHLFLGAPDETDEHRQSLLPAEGFFFDTGKKLWELDNFCFCWARVLQSFFSALASISQMRNYYISFLL